MKNFLAVLANRPLITSLIPATALLLIYAPALNFGYLWDDQIELLTTWSDAFIRWQTHPRLLYYSSFALTNPLFDAPWQHRLINYLLFAAAIVAAVHAARAFELRHPELLVFTVYAHPVFLYPVTWISQRNDLFLHLFLMLTLAFMSRRRGFVFLLLSDVSKTPFVFHNLWYIWRNWRSGLPRWYLVAAALAIPVIVLPSLVFWGHVHDTSTSPMTEFEASDILGLLFLLAVRSAKIAESVFLAHVPFPSYFGQYPAWLFAAATLLFLVAWGMILRMAWQGRRNWRQGLSWLALTLLMSIPFAINSDPRVVSPIVPLVFFAWASMAGEHRLFVPALVLILSLNLFGTFTSYSLSDTGIRNFQDAVSYELCGDRERTLPMDLWRCDRSHVAHRVVRDVNRLLGRGD